MISPENLVFSTYPIEGLRMREFGGPLFCYLADDMLPLESRMREKLAYDSKGSIIMAVISAETKNMRWNKYYAGAGSRHYICDRNDDAVHAPGQADQANAHLHQKAINQTAGVT